VDVADDVPPGRRGRELDSVRERRAEAAARLDADRGRVEDCDDVVLEVSRQAPS
jgi:hypothetical protein